MRQGVNRLATITVGLALFLVCSAGFHAMAQSPTGAINVTVTDSAGAVVPDAGLELRNIETNDIRKSTTQGSGNFSFQNLPFDHYRLTVSKTGFSNKVIESIQVQTARTTDIDVTLEVGATSQTVTVTGGEAPLVESSSSTLSNTIDTKQVVNLPVNGRNVMSFAFLVPGWANTGVGATTGTWNNMPGGAVVGADFDGTPGISNRFRSGGFQYGTTAVQPRIEDVGEMTISS